MTSFIVLVKHSNIAVNDYISLHTDNEGWRYSTSKLYTLMMSYLVKPRPFTVTSDAMEDGYS